LTNAALVLFESPRRLFSVSETQKMGQKCRLSFFHCVHVDPVTYNKLASFWQTQRESQFNL